MTPEQKIEARFWKRVEKVGLCWLWAGATSDKGYGVMRIEGKIVYAHRYSYEMWSGPIPPGLEIDHLCAIRSCVNPDHLEAVTHRVNMLRSDAPSAKRARMTHCKNGHEFTPENTQMYKTHRHCRTCRRDYMREYMRARKQN